MVEPRGPGLSGCARVERGEGPGGVGYEGEVVEDAALTISHGQHIHSVSAGGERNEAQTQGKQEKKPLTFGIPG